MKTLSTLARPDVEQHATSRSAKDDVTEVIDIDEMARRCGITVGTARAWRRTKYGPAGARVGRRVKYRAADVEAFLTALFEGRETA